MIAAIDSFLRRCFHAVVVVAAIASTQVITTPLHADFLTSFGSGGNQFNMVFVPIGNAGNAADNTGSPNPAGSVGYNYNMGKYEVSRDMVLKANAASGLGISLETIGSSGGNQPAVGVSWNEAARFVNWLNTSQGFSAAYKFTTQPGEGGYNANENIQLWLPTDAGYNAANLFRNSQAKYFLPSMDEWYKAAFYDPTKNGTGGYWNYATGSDAAPTAVSGGTSSNSAVYGQPYNQGPAEIDNAGGLSSYGVMGMNGNLEEWQETTYDLLNNNPLSSRSLRGGDWNFPSHLPEGFSSSGRIYGGPASGAFVGFRVASVPEPSSAAILMLLSTSALWQRRRRSS